MSLKSGYWYNKGEKFALYNFQGDEFHNKNMVCLDCPGIKDFMSLSVPWNHVFWELKDSIGSWIP